MTLLGARSTTMAHSEGDGSLSDTHALRLRAGVGRVRRARGETVLVPPGGASALRISSAGDTLIPLLMRGANRGELEAHLREHHPRARNVGTKLGQFLQQLESAGLLETTDAPAPPRVRGNRRIELCRPDPLARAIAGVLHRVPPFTSRALLIALALLAMASVAAVLTSALKPSPLGIVRLFDPIGLACFVLVVVPLHELAHAVACRSAGAAVQGAGLVFHGDLLPGPYVDTTQAYRVTSRWDRFWIPAAGPLVDLVAAGVSAWILLATGGSGAVADAARYVLLLSLAFVYFDTNPFTPSDGSRMIETLLDDELARQIALTRRRSLISPWYTFVLYRTACILHLACALALLLWLARP